jgi:hypothetical protein
MTDVHAVDCVFYQDNQELTALDLEGNVINDAVAAILGATVKVRRTRVMCRLPISPSCTVVCL